MWIGRRPDTTIYGAWRVRQQDDADHPGQEEVADDHPDVVAFTAPKPPTQDQLDAAAAKAYAKLAALMTMTPAQVQAWVAANVTNLAQAQDAIATLAIAVSVLARRL